jgi:hypothetical protein
MELTPQENLISRLAANRPLAHALFFKDRHANEDADFHHEMEISWASDIPNILTMAFRGSAKSTKAEEAITLEVAFQRCRNVLILGESEERAAERLAAIKHNIEYNEELNAVFNLAPGDPWQNTRACTSTGVMLQAYGRGQSLRGVKHLDHRPDLVFLDDIEDKESVATPEARRKTLAWFTSTVMPTLSPGGRMRMAATPLHPEALAPTLARAANSWRVQTFPIIYKNDTGEDTASWPSRFPVSIARKLQADMAELGRGEDFVQEYLCQATDPGSQTFTPDMMRIVPRARSWEPVYAIYDPARTTNKSSATTGKAVCSWIGRKLIVWESAAEKWMPNDIIEDIYATAERYNPTIVGVEENGLNEWLLQPLRTESVTRGTVLPLRALQAPRGKLDFIRSLQPYFRAGEVEFAQDMPELRAQLLGFPNGHIDAPNALAYMLKLGLGVPVYDNFREEHISDMERTPKGAAPYLLVNTNSQATTAALAVFTGGRLTVLWDQVVESDAGSCLTDLVKDAQLALAELFPPSRTAEAGRGVSPPTPRILAPPEHFDGYSTHGLRAAARGNRLTLYRGGDAQQGREEVRTLLRRSSHGRPSVQVGPKATWTSRAFAGGFARDANKTEPNKNTYSLLMEALESFAAITRQNPELDTTISYGYTPDGRRYISALAR